MTLSLPLLLTALIAPNSRQLPKSRHRPRSQSHSNQRMPLAVVLLSEQEVDSRFEPPLRAGRHHATGGCMRSALRDARRPRWNPARSAGTAACVILVLTTACGSPAAPSADLSGGWDFTFSAFSQVSCPGQPRRKDAHHGFNVFRVPGIDPGDRLASVFGQFKPCRMGPISTALPTDHAAPPPQ